MKNLVKAVAISAIMLSGMAVASGPTLYGKIHTSVDVMDNGGSNSDNSQYNETSVNSNASRIGVKGSEDVGNGMKVGYLIEWEVDMDGDSNDMGVRNRAVTLSGDWGTALVGKWDTPFKVLGRKVDLFGDQVGDLRNMTSVNTAGKYMGINYKVSGETIDNRWDNVIQYVSPDMSGFKLAVAYSTDTDTDGVYSGVEDSGDNQDNDGYSASAVYERNQYMVGLGYVSTDSNGIKGDSDDQKAWRIAGSYMPTTDIDLVVSYTDIDNMFFDKNRDTNVASVGGSYQMGNNKLKVQYAIRDDFDGTNDTGASMTTIGLDHSFSKRTEMYVAYSMVDNDDVSGTTPWMSSHDSNALGSVGDDSDVLSIGIIHKF